MEKISIIGLGYVGLPLACIIGAKKNKKLKVIGIEKKLNFLKKSKKEFLNNFSNKLCDLKLKKIIKKASHNKNFELSGDLKKIIN